MMIFAEKTCVYWPIQGISGARVARALDARADLWQAIPHRQ